MNRRRCRSAPDRHSNFDASARRRGIWIDCPQVTSSSGERPCSQCQTAACFACSPPAWRSPFATSFGLAADAPAKAKPATGPTSKPAYKYPAYEPIEDEPGLPRVLIIGDSISIGYHLPTRALLKGKANLHRPPENCEATVQALQKLDKWLGDPNTPSGKWDVIHFNWGLHDLKYHDGKGNIKPVDSGVQQVLLADYEKNLHELVKRLKATGATLIFATTTPVPEGARGRVPSDVAKYNEAAKRVMKEEGVTIDDLNAFITPKLAEYQNKADVHYNSRGYAALASEVFKRIEQALESRKAKKD